MAELNTPGSDHKKGRGVKKGKKLSTRVDLTPMVDLGFLLITFFIFTTALSKPTALKLILPRDTDDIDRPLVKDSHVITFLPGRNDQVYYYEGKDPMTLKVSNFKDIRNIILDKKRRTDPTYFQVIIKPTPDATYKNLVNILDEMTITAIPHFVLTDITPVEDRITRAAAVKN